MKKNRHHSNDSESSRDQPDSVYHVPVLLHEVIDALAIRPAGTYVDCTFGGGGHSRVILKHLNPDGRLLVFDQDADARRNVPDDERVIFIPHNYRHLNRFLRLHSAIPADGILADLGVSSHKFNEPERGFSTRFEGEMDMRMDTRQELTAYHIINTYSQEKLHRLFGEYGEVTNAKTLAALIVRIRETVNLKTISNFKSALHAVVKGNPNKYFAQVFQALRIEVNDELGALKEWLQQLPAVLGVNGRVAVITFHSLEDRLVKTYFKKGSFEEAEDLNPFINTQHKTELVPVNKKPILPSAEEVKLNPRSRSAKLRVAEKI